MDTILILDFGSQTTQLIGRRIRDLGVFSRVIPGDAPLAGELGGEVRGVILSGSPASVYDPDAPRPDPAVYGLKVPVLGICYGVQRLAQDHGGEVASLERKEYGRAAVRLTAPCDLLEGVPDGFISWMSHGDTIRRLPEGFHAVGVTENGLPAALVNEARRIYGLQFHPEVTHCEYGERILENFAVRICGAGRDWSVEAYLRELTPGLRSQVGGRNVLLLASGGVDSTVVAALLLAVLPPEQVRLLYVDTGLMRKGESREVGEALRRLGARHVHEVDASAEFFEALRAVVDPEEKRRRIGDLFIRVQEQSIAAAGFNNDYLAQGTLYTDLIESGKGVGRKAEVIKSHHNVRSPLVERKREQGLLLEPLSGLYKDEVRRLGRHLGVPAATVDRHPFPGPGLAVRILGEVTPEAVRVLREADALYIEELKARGLYDKIWQAFTVLLPVRSVGVAGDSRRYGFVLALRAVVSRDGMTADAYPFQAADLLEIAARLTNRVPEIGRVVYDVSSKPPATIEWE